MFNIIVTGSGRSGTSLTAQLLHDQGYHFSEDLIESNESNPNGFYESYEINRINEVLLESVFPNHNYGQRWLGALHNPLVNVTTPQMSEQMRAAIPKEPFVLKDPRFSYTLDAWREHISDCRFICVFRNPIATVNSIQKMLTVEPYLRDFALSREQTFTLWNAMYDSILSRDRAREHWLFLEYESIVSGIGLQQLSEFIGTNINTSLVDPDLQRSPKHGLNMPLRTALIYRRLLDLSLKRTVHKAGERAAEVA